MTDHDRTNESGQAPDPRNDEAAERTDARTVRTDGPTTVYVMAPGQGSAGGRVLRKVFGGILVLSVLLNVYLAVLLAMQFNLDFDRRTLVEGDATQTIAVYNVSDVITGDSADDFETFFRAVIDDGNVRAIVLRVDTPGGAVAPSDQMHALVKRLKDSGRAVVVSMGGVAASGGYYLSAPADEIVAEPTTITGSIGVIAMWPVMRETLDKLGMDVVVLKSHAARVWKDEMSFLHRPDERQEAHLQAVLDAMQGRFEDVVRQGRGPRIKTRERTYTLEVGEGDAQRQIEYTEVEPFNGKTYVSGEALEYGLVDSIGYLGHALERAKVLAKLTNAHVVEYRMHEGLLLQLFARFSHTGLRIDADLVDRIQTPRILMLWKAE